MAWTRARSTFPRFDALAATERRGAGELSAMPALSYPGPLQQHGRSNGSPRPHTSSRSRRATHVSSRCFFLFCFGFFGLLTFFGFSTLFVFLPARATSKSSDGRLLCGSAAARALSETRPGVGVPLTQMISRRQRATTTIAASRPVRHWPILSTALRALGGVVPLAAMFCLAPRGDGPESGNGTITSCQTRMWLLPRCRWAAKDTGTLPSSARGRGQ
jgi:hypothetical protein